MVQTRPDLYLWEYAQWLEDISGANIHAATIGRYLLKLGYRHGKLDIVARQRNESLVSEYIAMVATFQRHMFLFIDETSKDSTTFQRKYGYAKKGQKGATRVIGEYVRRHRVSLMAALDENGIIGTFVVENAFTADLFNLAIETEVLPYVGSFAHSECRSVIVLDNCAIHNQATIKLIQSKGGIIVFLPPYCPDLNPIELAFNQMKKWLMTNQDIAMQMPKVALIHAAACITHENATNYLSSCGY